MNKVIMMGRLTQDPNVNYAGSGESQTTVANFSIAVDRKKVREGDPTADFFKCTSFGKQAEFVEKYLKKGTKILVTGHIQNDNYTNKDGNQVYSVKIITEELEFAESKKNTDGQGQPSNNQQNQGQAQPSNNQQNGSDTSPATNSYNGEYDDELPFN